MLVEEPEQMTGTRSGTAGVGDTEATGPLHPTKGLDPPWFLPTFHVL